MRYILSGEITPYLHSSIKDLRTPSKTRLLAMNAPIYYTNCWNLQLGSTTNSTKKDRKKGNFQPILRILQEEASQTTLDLFTTILRADAYRIGRHKGAPYEATSASKTGN